MESNKKENELNLVTIEQAQKLKHLGFDWKTYKGFLKKSAAETHVIINRTVAANFNVLDDDDTDLKGLSDALSAPTIALALKWVRKRYGIFHSINTRSWSKEQPFVFSIWHNILPLDATGVDLSDRADDENDGAIFDYDEAEAKAFKYALNYLMRNIERDFSWITIGSKVYIPRYAKIGDSNFEELNVLEVNDHYNIVNVKSEIGDWTNWCSFQVLYKTSEEAEAKIISDIEDGV